MPEISFTKVQSVGNDFVLVRLEDIAEEQLPQLAIASAPRRTSIGNDGLLAVGASSGDNLVLRMFNTDGTEDFCGNGIRCAALYGVQHGLIGRKATICHHGHSVRVEVGEGGLVHSHFEPADYSPSAVPTCLDRELFFEEVEVLGERLIMSSVTTGSTHTIIFTDRLPTDEEIGTLGPAVEHLSIFPERTSVIWVKMSEHSAFGIRPSDTDADECTLVSSTADGPMPNAEGHCLEIRIWERGVGETLGCGTGSSAAAAVYLRALHESKIIAGSTPSSICVKNPGGPVLISMKAPNAPIISSAVAELLYTGRTKF